jgi:dihydrofolate reductase
MTSVTCQLSVSLDGYLAGPDQSLENPIGVGGMGLHEWAFGDDVADVDRGVVEHLLEGNGAYVMGRNMFAPGRGAWDPSWRGWWGEDPPYHAPVFVLTHHAREPLTMAGGTTFTFVTDGLDAAMEQARAAAGDRDVAIAGGASTVQQALVGGHLDEVSLHVVPIILGAGARLLQDVGDLRLEIAETIASPAATHVRYRVIR